MTKELKMKIAVTYDNGNVFQHFGHSEQFKVYEIENNKIINTQIVDSNDSGHSALAQLLDNADIDVLICGGIGGCAVSALGDCNIKLYAGVKGSADKAVEDYLSGALEQVSSANCSHHSHEHSDGHSCGHCH